MIISGGENIYPDKVEMCIMRLESVVDVAVIGVPDDKLGEAVKAVVVKKPGTELTEKDVIDHCEANLSKSWVPRSVDFVTDFINVVAN
ncbi:MAG: hypothetical protein WC749_04110 [Dehalococcoidia bacterium]